MGQKVYVIKYLNCSKCNKKVEVGQTCKSVLCELCTEKYMRDKIQLDDLKGGNMEDMVDKKEVKKVATKTETVKKPKEAKEKTAFGKTKYVKCSKCGEQKFAREEVYAARVKKFGSEEAMLKGYICRTCKKKA